jgi:hypothetical protein
MAIAFTKYIDITSGVGAGAAINARELIGRLFTNNPLIPTETVVEFTDADEVGAYFGSASEEYKRAAFYFSFISKNITAPKKLSFARWAAVDVAPRVYGASSISTLATLQAISTGGLSVTFGGTTLDLTTIDFSTTLSYADVASVLQTEIQAGVGAVFTAATVTFNAVDNRFELVGGAVGPFIMNIGNGTSGTQIKELIGWGVGARESDGVAAESITDVLTNSSDLTDNFGSFAFIPTLNLAQVTDAATWNDLQDVKYQFYVPVLAADTASWSAALINIGGVGLILDPAVTDEFPEMAPMNIMAATDYSRAASTQNYMFYQFDLTPSVTTTSLSDSYDALRVNYYGQTQTAGQRVEFFQRGYLMGLSTDPKDMNTYANEQWLKSYNGAKLMELFLNLPKVSANTQGRGLVLATLRSAIELALANGVISVGKDLSSSQKQYITTITGDQDAWRQVESSGFWLDVEIQQSGPDFKAVYILVYSKDDVVRKVEGSHILI